MTRVAIVDYGMGNLASVAKAFLALNCDVVVTDRAADLRAADRLVLPGVGAFREGMRNLVALGLVDVLREEALERRKPFLGICLGMQLLACEGEEYGHHQGLGWLAAWVRGLDAGVRGVKQLQIGWNEVTPRPGAPLFAGMGPAPTFYFVHGYQLVCEDENIVTGWAHHGARFVAAVQRDNVFGVQFHPEKSQEAGLGVLRRFLHWQGATPACALGATPDTGGSPVKIRVVPTLLLEGDRLVKTMAFGRRRHVGDPLKAPMVYDAQLADELVYLDITATREERGVDRLCTAVERITGECFMPLTAGGGVRAEDDIRALLKAGADRVAINSAAVADPDLLARAARRFGRQCVVVSIDVRRHPDGRAEVFTHGGTRATGLEPVAWARRAVAEGAGEVLLTSIDRDGSFQGYDLPLVRAVADAVEVPVIASGGAGTVRDLVDAVTTGHASAVAAASMFHFRDLTPIKVKAGLRRAGLAVR